MTSRKLFEPIVPTEKLCQEFRFMVIPDAREPARTEMQRLFDLLPNPDGNFIQDFQTTGFSARVWELYLFAVARAVGLEVERNYDRPDFLFKGWNESVWVEAVTSRPGAQEAPDIPDEEDAGYQEALRARYEGFLPRRLGSTLYSKLQAKYWELDHVRDMPFVIAIQDFHDPDTLRDTSSSLQSYLYGVRFHVESEAGEPLDVRMETVKAHTYEGKTSPSGFFSLPGAENVSAVLFSNSATVAKFNRMAYNPTRHTGFRLFRKGTELDPNPDEILPRPFAYVVGHDPHTETWSEGLEIFHNPNAKRPVSPGFFQCSVEIAMVDGEISQSTAPFHPMMSETTFHHRMSVAKLRELAAAYVRELGAEREKMRETARQYMRGRQKP